MGEKFETRQQPEKAPESQEIGKAANLCAIYHQYLDTTSYFDSKAIKYASELLPKFRAIKRESLPQSVKLVVEHRIAYLTVLNSLKSNSAIGAFLDSVKSKFGEAGLFNRDPKTLFEALRSNEKFKTLTPFDFRQILSSVQAGIGMLKLVNSKGNTDWAKAAEGSLQRASISRVDSRIDDQKAAIYLEQGFTKVVEFAQYALEQMGAPKVNRTNPTKKSNVL